jgi:hypothetical protein
MPQAGGAPLGGAWRVGVWWGTKFVTGNPENSSLLGPKFVTRSPGPTKFVARTTENRHQDRHSSPALTKFVTGTSDRKIRHRDRLQFVTGTNEICHQVEPLSWNCRVFLVAQFVTGTFGLPSRRQISYLHSGCCRCCKIDPRFLTG